MDIKQKLEEVRRLNEEDAKKWVAFFQKVGDEESLKRAKMDLKKWQGRKIPM